jgi:hypothetical protein
LYTIIDDSSLELQRDKVTTKDEHFLQHGLIAVFTIAVLAIFGMVLLVYQTPERQIVTADEYENAVGMGSSACIVDDACFTTCLQTLSSRMDIPITETCRKDCCAGANLAGQAFQPGQGPGRR